MNSVTLRVLLLACALICGAAGAAEASPCYWYVQDIAYITSWGYFVIGDEVRYIPLGTEMIYYWGVYCPPDFPSPTQPETPNVPYLPQVTIDSVDTSNPGNFVVRASASSPNAAIREVSLIIGGQRAQTVPVPGDGTYDIPAGSVRALPIGTTELQVEACDTFYNCKIASTRVSRGGSVQNVSEEVLAYGVAGDEFIRGVYGHEFRLDHIKTTWFVNVISDNARMELNATSVVIHRQAPNPQPIWDASVVSAGAFGDADINLEPCFASPYTCTDCDLKCGRLDVIGLFPRATDHLTDFRFEVTRGATIQGGSLTIQP